MEERSPSSAVSCNRKPFVSDQSCDRGSVDTNMFSDLPYCETISPTMPEIPPEIVDPEIVIPVPPPCACVNIDYKFNFGGYKSGFSAKSEFKAKGDCCEGSYDTNFDFEFPCPINKFGKKKFRATIDWDKQQVHEQTYIEPKSDCGLDPKDITFTIGLPCPIIGEKSQLNLNLQWDNPQKWTSVIASKSGKKCGIQLFENNVEIGLPCPIKNVESEININLGWDSPKTGSVKVARKTGDCEVNLDGGTFNIGLPCPVVGSESAMKVELDWDVPKSGRAVVAEKSGEDCGIEMREASLKVGLPCPVQQVDASLSVGVEWNKPSSEKKTFLRNSGNCELEAEDVEMTIGLPCPILGEGEADISIEYGNRFKGDKKTIAKRKGDCELEFENPKFELTIPCPLDTLTLKGAIIPSASWGISVEQSGGISACSKTFTVKLNVPDNIINTHENCIDVISGLDFSFPSVMYLTHRICGQFKLETSSWQSLRLPTTKHRVKCSNDS